MLLLWSPRLQRLAIHLNFIPGRVNGVSWILEPPSRYGFWSPIPSDKPLRIETEDGESLGAWLIGDQAAEAQKDDPSLVFLYCHGNAASRAISLRRAVYKNLLSMKNGSQLLVFDYRGFGDSTGTPTQEGLLKDVRAAWNWLVKTRSIDPNRIVLVGQSLGTAVAHMFLSNDNVQPKATILLSPLVSIPDTVYHYLWARFLVIPWPIYCLVSPAAMTAFFKKHVVDAYDVNDMLAQYYDKGSDKTIFGIGATANSMMPLIYVHGTRDFMVPYDHGKQLYLDELTQRQRSDLKASSLGEYLVRAIDYPQGAPETHILAHPLEKIAFITMWGYGHNDMNYAHVTAASLGKAFEVMHVSL